MYHLLKSRKENPQNNMTLRINDNKTLRINDNKLFKKKSYRYINISVILSPIAGFLSLVRVTQFSNV